MRTRAWSCVCVLAGVALVASLGSASAGEVTLRMRGGTFEVKGDLLTRDARSYVLDVPGIGKLTLDANRYECIGPNCPSPAAGNRALSLAPGAPPPTTTWVGAAPSARK